MNEFERLLRVEAAARRLVEPGPRWQQTEAAAELRQLLALAPKPPVLDPDGHLVKAAQ